MLGSHFVSGPSLLHSLITDLTHIKIIVTTTECVVLCFIEAIAASKITLLQITISLCMIHVTNDHM